MRRIHLVVLLTATVVVSGCIDTTTENISLEGEYRTIDFVVNHETETYNMTYKEWIDLHGYDITPSEEAESETQDGENLNIDTEMYLRSNINAICRKSERMTQSTESYLDEWESVSREIINPPQDRTQLDENSRKIDELIQNYENTGFKTKVYDIETGRKLAECTKNNEGSLEEELVV